MNAEGMEVKGMMVVMTGEAEEVDPGNGESEDWEQ